MRIEIACSLLSRLRGLLGRDSFDGVLLLMPCNDVHTYGMRHALDIAFIASSGEVVGAYRQVGARCRIRCKTAAAVLERFADDSPWLEQGEYVELKDYIRDQRRS